MEAILIKQVRASAWSSDTRMASNNFLLEAVVCDEATNRQKAKTNKATNQLSGKTCYDLGKHVVVAHRPCNELP